MALSSAASKLALLVATLGVSVSATFVNVDVRRVINVASTIAISRTTIHMKNTGSKPVSSFHLAVQKTEASGLGDLWAADSSSGNPLRALPLEPDDDVPGLKGCCRGFRVTLPKAIPPGGETTVDVRMDVAGAIRPVPDVIEGHDMQYMRYVGSSYFFTPYKTQSMTTSITLGSTTVTSKKGLKEPFEMVGKKLVMGPYKDVAPLSYNEISVRFENNRGFLVARRAVKEFYVNHLGNIAVKEEFDVVNDGARHSGEWSREDHAGGYSKYRSVMGDVWANLPEDASHVQYKDLLGNVTTSRLRKGSKGKRAIQLTYRYPLVGGWHNYFWVAYEMVLSKYVRSHGGEHEIELPVFPSLNTDLVCEKYDVRVLLPEWSYSIQVLPHESLQMEIRKTSERTTLTMFGRPVITISLKMLRSQSKHAKTVRIKYRYNTWLSWVTPSLVALGILMVVVGFIMCVRTGLGIVDQEDETMAQKGKVKDL